MNNLAEKNIFSYSILSPAADYILSCQRTDGAILWFEGDKLDPWDHTEAAMGLAILGHTKGALDAFTWLKENQRADGSWYANYIAPPQPTSSPEAASPQTHSSNTQHKKNVLPLINSTDKIETNFVAYPATGLWYCYLATKNKAFLTEYIDMVELAIEFIISQQTPQGDIQWAISESENLPNDALITACSSVARSLESAIHIMRELGTPKPHWLKAYNKLVAALLHKPECFDRTWESKERFSMDWFYPVLAGIYSPAQASERLDSRWNEFVEKGIGCRCVSDQPWMTVAESCELTLALIAANRREDALNIYQNLYRWQDTDGGFWTGYNFKNKNIWPEEKTSWTAAATLLAADALFKITPAHKVFTQESDL